MPRNKHALYALFKEYWERGAATRTEVGQLVGLGRNQMAGLCHDLKLKHWPRVTAKDKKARVGCCFPIGIPGIKSFRLCGKPLSPGTTLVCEEHVDQTIWAPPTT